MLILTPLLKINQSLKVFLGKIFSSSRECPTELNDYFPLPILTHNILWSGSPEIHEKPWRTVRWGEISWVVGNTNKPRMTVECSVPPSPAGVATWQVAGEGRWVTRDLCLMVKCTLTVVVTLHYTHLGWGPGPSLARSSSQARLAVKKLMVRRREGRIPPLLLLLILKRNELSTGGTWGKLWARYFLPRITNCHHLTISHVSLAL